MNFCSSSTTNAAGVGFSWKLLLPKQKKF